MTYTKSNGILKRLGALVMALGLTCALAVSASAATSDDLAGEYTVTFLKNGQDSTSMSDRAVGNRTAVVSVEDGVATVTIELKPIEGYLGADGWVASVQVPGAEAEVVGHGGEYGDIKTILGGSHATNFHFYETATLTITTDTLVADDDGTIKISNVQPTTELVYAGTKTHYVLPSSMVNAEFDIELVKQ